MVTFFAIAGRIDLFDLIGLPDVVPHHPEWRMRGVLRTFEQAPRLPHRRRALRNLDQNPS